MCSRFFGYSFPFKMNNQTTLLIKSFDLATTLSISVTAIVLIGVVCSQLFMMTGERQKLLAKNFLILIGLVEAALILDFLANSSTHLISLYGFEIIIATAAIIWGIVVLIRFYDFIEKRLLFSAMVLGVIAILSILGTWLFDSNLSRVIGNIAANGVFICLYFLIMVFIIKHQDKK